MYQVIDDIPVISKNDWINAGLSKSTFEHDSKNGDLVIFRRGINGNTLIDVRSIKRQERVRVIEQAFGKVSEAPKKSIYKVETDTQARLFYATYLKQDGEPLPNDKVTEYTNRASVFNALRDGMQKQIDARAKGGNRLKLSEFWQERLKWHTEMAVEYNIPVFSNTRSLERAFKEYIKNGYKAIIHKNFANDNARVVSASAENLILAIWRTNDHPFVNRVHELYLEFVSGEREFFDKETGEIYNPESFRHNGKALEISRCTIWNYLKDVINNTAVYADRNGNFDYANSRRPKHHRKVGQYSLSKISMDDVAMSRKSIRGWVYKYMAVDVVSGYWFTPAYVVGKPTLQTVYESFRNVFCELSVLGMPMPGELEVEYHLMKDINWLNELFPFVRFCESPTEKRAEHNIKALKYGSAKKAGHTRGRWYAKHEAWRSIRNKVEGDFVEPEYQPQNIIADDLADIERHNNSLHPLQKTYPGMTRKEVFLQNINPTLKPIENRYLYKFIGNETDCTIYNNDYVKAANTEFELTNFDSLKRLKPNNVQVKAYWLPEENGSVQKVFIYQDDTYIGEAINRDDSDYNECAIERTEEDETAMLHQQKRTAKYDKKIRERKALIPKIGTMESKVSDAVANIPVTIIETTQPKGLDDNDFETIDYSLLAKQQL